MATCKQCSKFFEITDRDRSFYDRASPVMNGKKFHIPEPRMCPDCRQQHRLAFINRRKIYRRRCSATGDSIISIYSPDKPYTVYNRDFWFSDKWDPLKYGRPFNPKRPFFEQFKELMKEVPVLSLVLFGKNENSEYNNDNCNLKNCYLVFDGSKGEDCYYGESFVQINDCADFLFLERSQLCYEVIYGYDCYNVKYSRYVKNCSDSWFLRDCVGCKNCFGCANVNQKEYYIFNKPYSRQEYEDFMKEFESGSCRVIEATKKKAEEFHLTQPVRAMHGIQNENVIGDNLNHCRNAFYCFDSNYLKDCEYISDDQVGASDCWDIDIWGEGIELCYNSTAIGIGLRNVISGYYVTEGGHDIYYSILCGRNSNNLFGCIGLKHKEYCILNKEYKRDEYFKKVQEIIEQMRKDGVWGDFFPPDVSYFGYNETLAQDFYPLAKEEIEQRGWKWHVRDDMIPDIEKIIDAKDLPDNSRDITASLEHTGIQCARTGRPFRITDQELNFYKHHRLPLPRLHPEERHLDRVHKRNPHHLWMRNCSKCNEEIQTSYAPGRPEIVYCEACYLKAVY